MSLSAQDRKRWESVLDDLAAQAARDANRHNDTDLAHVARLLADAADYMREMEP